MTRSSAKRAARAGTASCAGSSTRSTARSTSCSASPCSRSAWPARTETARWWASCSIRSATRRSRRRGRGCRAQRSPRSRARASEDLSRALVATGFAYDAASGPRRRWRSAGCCRAFATFAGRGGGAGPGLVCLRPLRRLLRARRQGLGHRRRGPVCERAGLAARELREGSDGPSGVLVAPPALVDELLGLVLDA